MRWYKRLFFKSFLIVWLTSFLLLAMAVVGVSLVAEKDNMRQLLEARSRGIAERIIERYERRLVLRGQSGSLAHYEERNEHHSHRWHERRSPRPRIWEPVTQLRIVDLKSDRVIKGPPQFRNHRAEVIDFELHSAAGRRYRVELEVDWKRSPLRRFIGSVLSLQLLLILLVSAVAGLLLSAIIVRPLNRLRNSVQALSQGELEIRADEKLCLRGDELGELAREFNRMADYVEQTLGSHQRLLQDVSHELRAPLARLQAAAGLAEQKWGQEERTVQRINRECERLNLLIGEILSLSRLESQGSESQPIDLAALLGQLLEDYRFSHPGRAFSLDIAQLPESCRGNQGLLERALGNVIGNACKHTPEGSAIDLSVKTLQGQSVIQVRDHGRGVLEADLKRLCEPFYRGNSGEEGYGLGLSIAQRAMSRSGGRLSLENHPDGGLLVTLWLS
ncbi:HAMP domain-containing sensor histidine kinase [Marinobacterium jannaschii]|uniref:HAMP domain-containing sensor histidine kinase n=1 Tax=Marinobacterium jannaschii TaxID=64970 RepID=UPI000487CEF3|nr:ATP-binding protein [Marinobacterium jannaschii]